MVRSGTVFAFAFMIFYRQPILVIISTWELNKKFEREYASR
jgi:hypothetical protein